MINVEKELASMALEHAKSVKGKDYKGDYKSLVKGFGARIMNNGILGAMAFLAAKGDLSDKKKIHYWLLFYHISEAVNNISGIQAFKSENMSKAFGKIEEIQGNKDKLREEKKKITGEIETILRWLSNPSNITDYFYVQELSLTYISYLRRYVDALIEEEKDNGQA